MFSKVRYFWRACLFLSNNPIYNNFKFSVILIDIDHSFFSEIFILYKPQLDFSLIFTSSSEEICKVSQIVWIQFIGIWIVPLIQRVIVASVLSQAYASSFCCMFFSDQSFFKFSPKVLSLGIIVNSLFLNYNKI